MDLKTRRLNPKYRHCEDDGESDGFNLEEVTNKIFLESEQVFKKIGATVTADKTEGTNPLLVVKRNKVEAQLFGNKNIIRINGKGHELEVLL